MASKQKLLEEAKNLTQQECDGLRYETYLKVEGQYFITVNVNVQDGLFNGATGIIKYLEYNQHSPSTSKELRTVWILFENPLIGCEKKKKVHERSWR